MSKLPERTASAATSGVKKNVKQILTLERERVAGGDGFLSAAQTAAKARGEVLEVGRPKKKPKLEFGKRGMNLKGRGSRLGSVAGTASGMATPMTEELESGQTTPVADGDDVKELEGKLDGIVRKEVITCESATPSFQPFLTRRADHTPTAPPSLLPLKKYCDITGLHANYTDPRTKLRYKGLEVWHVVRGLVGPASFPLNVAHMDIQGPGGDQAYLALRGAHTSLK